MAKGIEAQTILAGKDGAAWMQSYNGRVYLRRHYVNRDGYDRSGCYWGYLKNEPVYYILAEGESDESGRFFYHEDYFRAKNRIEAVGIARDLFPNGIIQP